PSTRFAATTGSVIMNVVKIGAQLLSPNQMMAMTIQTKTEVAFSTVTTSRTTVRAARERNASRPIRSPTTTAPPKPITMRKSDAPVCVQTSPLRSTATKPATTDHGDGSTYAPYLHDNAVHPTSMTAATASVGRWKRSAIKKLLADAVGIVPEV